jgi:hypothetical protein
MEVTVVEFIMQECQEMSGNTYIMLLVTLLGRRTEKRTVPLSAEA